MAFKPIAYLKEGCPYSFKFLLFLSESRLIDLFEIVRCDPDDAQYESVKEKLANATGKKATFPTAEIEPGVYKSDSDALVALYANSRGIDTESLAAFSFYMRSIFKQLAKQH